MKGCRCDGSPQLCAQCQALLARSQGAAAVGVEMSEKQLLSRVEVVCRRLGLLYYHTYRSTKSPAGFVDMVAIHPEGGVLYMQELKREGERPRLDQQRWLDALARVTRVEAGVVRPSGLEAFVRTLQTGKG